MYFTKDESYYLMYYTLNFYYFEKGKDDSVGSFLGDINPGKNINQTPDSSDPAAYYDWKKMFSENKFPENINEYKAFDAMLTFIKIYNLNFEIPSKEVVEYFEKEEINSPEWRKAVKKAKSQLEEKSNPDN